MIIARVEGVGGGNYGDPCQTIKTDMMEWGATLTSGGHLSPPVSSLEGDICQYLCSRAGVI